jgi:uncharacterized protein (DUF305 family)
MTSVSTLLSPERMAAVRRQLTPQRMRIAGMVLGAVILLLVGFFAGALSRTSGTPGENSPEAGFARDMSEHHAQAVEMGMIAYQRATSRDVRTLGGDIAITQQGQIGVMNTWLKDWDLGPTGSRPPMAWMPDGQRALNGNLMPGMATATEMAKLRAAKGKNVDILFCQYMLRHHLGGIHMVQGLLSETSNPDVRYLATTMLNGQTNEVAVLRNLLSTLGAKPLP